jgi:hypothetical protein
MTTHIIDKRSDRIVFKGAILPNFDPSTGKGSIAGKDFRVDGPVIQPKCSEPYSYDQVLELAACAQNTGYRWGGRAYLAGFDCSGLSQQVMKLLGRSLLRYSYEQAQQGENVQNIELAQTGDLAFFNVRGFEGVKHVGILDITDKDGPWLYHASGGRVRHESLAAFFERLPKVELCAIRRMQTETQKLVMPITA